MLESVDELFEDIPQDLRLGRPLDLPDGVPETEVYDALSALAARNSDAESELSFLGAGMYDHYVPALVDAIISRSEFLTPYTPYQPEISQGGLQAMFEFQTAMSELTGLARLERGAVRGPFRRRLRRLPGDRRNRPNASSLPRAASTPTAARRSSHTGPATAPSWSRSRWPTGSPTPPRWPRPSTRTPPLSSCSSPTSWGPSRTSRGSASAPARWAPWSSSLATRSRSRS